MEQEKKRILFASMTSRANHSRSSSAGKIVIITVSATSSGPMGDVFDGGSKSRTGGSRFHEDSVPSNPHTGKQGISGVGLQSGKRDRLAAQRTKKD